MKLLENLSGKKKSLILAIAGIVGLMLIIFGTFGEKKEEIEEFSKNTKEIYSAFVHSIMARFTMLRSFSRYSA